MTIEDRGNGWHVGTTRLRVNDHDEVGTFRWRTQRHHCGWSTVTIADGASVPVWYNVEELRGDVTLCSECGQTFEARVTRVSPETILN